MLFSATRGPRYVPDESGHDDSPKRRDKNDRIATRLMLAFCAAMFALGAIARLLL